jgi:hypothetical protein
VDTSLNCCDISVLGKLQACVGNSLIYRAYPIGGNSVSWSIGAGGTPSSGSGTTHTVQFNNKGTTPVETSLMCDNGLSASYTIGVNVLGDELLPNSSETINYNFQEKDLFLFKIPNFTTNINLTHERMKKCCLEFSDTLGQQCFSQSTGTASGTVDAPTFDIPGAGTLLKAIDKIICEKLADYLPDGVFECSVGATVGATTVNLNSNDVEFKYDGCAFGRNNWTGTTGSIAIDEVKLSLAISINILGAEGSCELFGLDNIEANFSGDLTDFNFSVFEKGGEAGGICTTSLPDPFDKFSLTVKFGPFPEINTSFSTPAPHVNVSCN